MRKNLPTVVLLGLKVWELKDTVKQLTRTLFSVIKKNRKCRK